jgi:hypothetical protein
MGDVGGSSEVAIGQCRVTMRWRVAPTAAGGTVATARRREREQQGHDAEH